MSHRAMCQLWDVAPTDSAHAVPYLPPLPSFAMGPNTARLPMEVSRMPEFSVREDCSASRLSSAFSCTASSREAVGDAHTSFAAVQQPTAAASTQLCTHLESVGHCGEQREQQAASLAPQEYCRHNEEARAG